MNTLEKLQHLITHCHTVSMGTNDHRTMYRTVKDHFEEEEFLRDADNVSPEVVAACIQADCIVTIQIYPRTPIGFNHYVGHSLESAVNTAYEDMFIPPKDSPAAVPPGEGGQKPR